MNAVDQVEIKDVGYNSHKEEVFTYLMKRFNVIRALFDAYKAVNDRDNMIDCLARHEELELLFNELTKDLD